MEQEEIFAGFVQKWTHPDYRPKPVTEIELVHVERELEIVFPLSYRSYMLRFGVGGTTLKLLDSIVEGELEISDLSEFHSTNEIIESTLGWRKAGMPSDLVSFARDCMGNLFCFKTGECKSCHPDAPVWFFDHDFLIVKKASNDFTGLIYQQLMVELIDV